MRKRGKRTSWRRKQAEGGWTGQTLDLDPADGRSAADVDPRGDDAAAGEGGFDAAGGRGDPIDDVLDGRAPADADGRDPGGDLELRTDADPLADVAEGLHAGLRDGRGGAIGDADVDDAGPAPGSPVPDGYAPISVGELESRVEGGAARPGPAEPSPEAASEFGYGAEAGDDEAGAEESAPGGEAGAVSFGGGDAGGAGGGGDEFALTSEEPYDYGLEDEDEPEDPAPEIFGGGSGEPASRLPVALVAAIGVAVAVTAFVIGLGWMGGDGGDAADVVEEAPPAADDDPGPEFSEGVVDGAAPGPSAAGAADDDSPAVAATSLGGAPAAGGNASPASRDASPSAPAPAVRRPAPVSPPPPAPAPPTGAPAPAPTPADGRLLVRSTPPGAEVIVNGQPRGTTPLALAALPYGSYEVEVTLAGYGSRRAEFVRGNGS